MLQIVKQTYSIREAGRVLGLSRNSAYEAAKMGQLPTIKVGKRLLVPVVALSRMLDSAKPSVVSQ